jgi:hypothetical protein
VISDFRLIFSVLIDGKNDNVFLEILEGLLYGMNSKIRGYVEIVEILQNLIPSYLSSIYSLKRRSSLSSSTVKAFGRAGAQVSHRHQERLCWTYFWYADAI